MPEKSVFGTPSNIPPLEISGNMKVKSLREQFKSVFGLALRVYKADGTAADDSATLASIRAGAKATEATAHLRQSSKVSSVPVFFKRELGLVVDVFSADDTELPDKDATLKAAAEGQSEPAASKPVKSKEPAPAAEPKKEKAEPKPKAEKAPAPPAEPPKPKADALIDGATYNKDGIELVYVEGKDDIKGFYIGKYPVTQPQYQKIMGKNPSNWKGENLPVEQVSWHDAQEFLELLSDASGKKYRLPTEKEWEFAARGGKNGSGFEYSGSNTINIAAWWKENSGGRTQPVGTKKANELGLHDMCGNVLEWCQDESVGSHSGTKYRSVRGGSYGSASDDCKATSGARFEPTYRSSGVGFRVVMS